MRAVGGRGTFDNTPQAIVPERMAKPEPEELVKMEVDGEEEAETSSPKKARKDKDGKKEGKEKKKKVKKE